MFTYITRWDLLGVHALHEFFSSPFADTFFSWITRLGDGGAIWILFGILCLFFKPYRKMGTEILLVLALGYVTGNLFLKNIVDRPRPFVVDPNIHLIIPPPKEAGSFPSGHTLSSFEAAWIILSHRKKPGYFAFLLAAFIALSRIYLQVHFPTDIFGGILLAYGMVYLTKKLVRRREQYDY